MSVSSLLDPTVGRTSTTLLSPRNWEPETRRAIPLALALISRYITTQPRI
jgi:hypothetical protein